MCNASIFYEQRKKSEFYRKIYRFEERKSKLANQQPFKVITDIFCVLIYVIIAF